MYKQCYKKRYICFNSTAHTKTMKNRLKKIKHKIVALLSQGLSAKKITQSVIFSTLFTVIPLFGVSTFLITLISIKKKLNLPIMIALSYVIWPFQILLLIPFMKIGELIFSIPPRSHSIDEIIALYQESFFKLISRLSLDLLYALAAWVLVAVPISFILYWITLLVFKISSKKESVLKDV
jgi:hypothetical protein